jgi:uncharacterized phiE125 gp8 family phage protein
VHKTVLAVAPTEEPITLAEAKSHLYVTSDDLDSDITKLITTTRRMLERYLNRAILTQQWKVYYNCWQNEMLIPYPKLQSVQTVKYRDLDGALQTLTIDDFLWVVTTDEPAKLVRKYDANLPNLEYGRPDSIEIAYTAGWLMTAGGGLVETCPEEVKHAMKVMLTNYFEHRGDIVIGNIAHKIPDHITDLVHTYKIYSF